MGGLVVPKCGPGHILTLLAFGPVSLRLLDLGVLHGRATAAEKAEEGHGGHSAPEIDA